MIIEKGNIWLFQLVYRILRGSLTKVINVLEALKMGSVLYGAEQNRSRGQFIVIAINIIITIYLITFFFNPLEKILKSIYSTHKHKKLHILNVMTKNITYGFSVKFCSQKQIICTHIAEFEFLIFENSILARKKFL